MPYFSDHYASLTLPPEAPGKPGLRNAQLGAIHAIASHFTLHEDPAIVVMPTGSGKTAVLMAAPYILRASRILVVTPSRLVRNQILAQWRTIEPLKSLGLVPAHIPPPNTKEIASKLTTVAAWGELALFDVVVGTPQSVSPAIPGVATPPQDLFDLILIDEAHHSPARTWNALAAAFPAARRVLFTATPFRHDQREIQGTFVYTYPVSRAFRDRIFGEVVYVPVLEDDGSDRAVAQHTAAELAKDRQAGYSHFVFVRTDSQKRAEELDALYKEVTNLRLTVVHSGYSLRFILEKIRALKNNELDGVICVDMLGEGFDLPNLKIAAIHKPHKSLAITLQFVGRFARTNAPDIGPAKFIAAPSDIRIEAERLFKEGAIWQEIIIGLGDDRIAREVTLRKQLATFQRMPIEEEVTHDLSLYSLRPYHHVKILRLNGALNLDANVILPSPFEVIHREVSQDLGVSIFLTVERRIPRWSDSERFARVEYDLFIVYHDVTHNLLFIAASRRLEPLYSDIASQFCPDGTRRLSLNHLNRALRPFPGLAFYNVGMRNRVQTSNTESYRIMTGSSADRAIGPTDGRLFFQGHCFGGTSDADNTVTIGISSGSKIWSNRYSQVPEFLDWCRGLAVQLANDGEFRTFSGLDHLPVAREIDRLPAVAIAAEWNAESFQDTPIIQFRGEGGETLETNLVSCELIPDRNEPGAHSVGIELRGERLEFRFDLLVSGEIQGVGDREPSVLLHDEEWSLSKYVEAFPLTIYLSDLSSISGSELSPANYVTELAVDRVDVTDWAGLGVDICTEVGQKTSQGISIHDYTRARLLASPAQVIFYDHDPGEIADFLSIEDKGDSVDFMFLHCKASHERLPGSRVNDAYDIAGQVVKGTRWVQVFDPLIEHCQRRNAGRLVSRFVRGDLAVLGNLVQKGRMNSSRWVIVLVQPGLSFGALTAAVQPVLASAADYVRAVGAEMRLLISS